MHSSPPTVKFELGKFLVLNEGRAFRLARRGEHMRNNWKKGAAAALAATLACGLLAAVPAAAQAKVVDDGNYACSKSATGSHS